MTRRPQSRFARGLAVAATATSLACAGSACGDSQATKQPTRNARLSGRVMVCRTLFRGCTLVAANVTVFSVHGSRFGKAVAKQDALHGRFSFLVSPGEYFLSASAVRTRLEVGHCISGEVVIRAREYVLDAITCYVRISGRRVGSDSASRDSRTSRRDRASTHAYLRARYELEQSAKATLAATKSAEARFVADVSRECPGVLTGSPAQSGTIKGRNGVAFLNGRVLVSVAIVQGVGVAGQKPLEPAQRKFVTAIRRLAWRDHRLTTLVRAFAASESATLAQPAPAICRDAEAWRRSGFRTLTQRSTRPSPDVEAASRALSHALRALAFHNARPEVVLWKVLATYEDPTERVESHAVEEVEREVRTSQVRMLNDASAHLERALGLR
jgi:hypothetical protein